MAPIFVGSNSDDTRIRSNRVGLAASTSDPGSASEGDIYYNSTGNQIKTYDGSSWSAIQGSGSLEAVASGSLSNGQTVILQSDGTVTGVAATSRTESLGSEVVYGTGNSQWNTGCYDTDNKKIIITYRDLGNSGYGTYVVGTVSGTSISFGTPAVFNDSSTVYNNVIYDTANSRVVVFYRTGTSPYNGKCRVGTVSGNTITWGSEYTFDNAGTASYLNAVFHPDSGKCLIFYSMYASSVYSGRCAVGTVDSSDNSITFEKVLFSDIRVDGVDCCYDSTTGKILIAYKKGVSNKAAGLSAVGTVVGTGITFGPPGMWKFWGNNIGDQVNAVYDENSKKIVVIYKDPADSNYGKARVGTVIGDMIYWGTDDVRIDSSDGVDLIQSEYDPRAKKVVVAYKQGSSPEKGQYVVGTVVGNGITFASPSDMDSSESQSINITYDSDQERIVLMYRDTGNSNVGTARVLQNAFSGSNVTEGNFIGFSDAAYSDGDTAKVQLVSTIDDAQSGLTTGSKFYVQNDGSLGTTADDPSVIAGTAVSGTEILIKQ